MTRTLPWLKRPRTTTAQATRLARTAAPRAKRPRVFEPSSDIDDAGWVDSGRQRSLTGRASPLAPLEPPSESSMDEGLDKDDQYRMVEDEFLDAAKQFTQHLHAAEYQRLKKAAKSQNAATINSISRPVTIRMPDETRRKVESVARSKKQATALNGLLGRKSLGSGTDEDSDDGGNSWHGTALYGLMESPRRAVASLTKVTKVRATTRAAVGFHKARHQKASNHSRSVSPGPGTFDQPTEKLKFKTGNVTESSDDDDDLDAPIRPTKLTKATTFIVQPSSHFTELDSNVHHSKQTEVYIKPSPPNAPENHVDDMPLRSSLKARERIAKRLEQARLRETKQEQEAHIPTFLS